MRLLWILVLAMVILTSCGQSDMRPEPIYDDELPTAQDLGVEEPEEPVIEPVEEAKEVIEEPQEPPKEELTEEEPAEATETVEAGETQTAQPVELGVIIQDFKFQPFELTIKKGTKVTWVNQDSAPHTSSGVSFDSGSINKGQSFSHTFDEVGTFDYQCNIHSSMKGKVVVE